MQDVIKTIRTQCEYGAQDSLTTDNRKTILTQLENCVINYIQKEMRIMPAERYLPDTAQIKS